MIVVEMVVVVVGRKDRYTWWQEDTAPMKETVRWNNIYIRIHTCTCMYDTALTNLLTEEEWDIYKHS